MKTNGLVQLEWFGVTAVGLRRNRQKYKRQMDKSSLKWNSIRIQRAPQNYKNYIIFRRPLIVFRRLKTMNRFITFPGYGSYCLDGKCAVV